MDVIDRKILNILQKNSQLNTKEIAAKIGLTVSPTFERIKKLEKAGIIRNYVALLDRHKINRQIVAYCQILLFKHSKQLIDEFKQKALQLPEVMECHHVSGNYDFLLKVALENMNEYQDFVVNKLSVIEGISNMQSSFVLEEVRNETGYFFQ